jgi:hypothetical protein
MLAKIIERAAALKAGRPAESRTASPRKRESPQSRKRVPQPKPARAIKVRKKTRA